MSYGMEYPSGQFKSAVLILSFPSPQALCCERPLLCTTLLGSNYKRCMLYQHCSSPKAKTASYQTLWQKQFHPSWNYDTDECDWKGDWGFEHKVQMRRRKSQMRRRKSSRTLKMVRIFFPWQGDFFFNPCPLSFDFDMSCFSHKIGDVQVLNPVRLLLHLLFWVILLLLLRITVSHCFVREDTVHGENFIVIVYQRRWNAKFNREWKQSIKNAVFYKWYILFMRKYFWVSFILWQL